MTPQPPRDPSAWEARLGVGSRAQVERAIAATLPTLRWFGNKGRSIERVATRDAFVLGAHTVILLVEIEYADGTDPETYVLPLTTRRPVKTARDGETRGGETRDGEPARGALTLTMEDAAGGHRALRDALFCGEACRELLVHLATASRLTGITGELVFLPGPSLRRHALDTLPNGTVVNAEQSNTSVLFARTYMLKVFRRLEAGTQPDIEIGAYLTRRGFRHAPAFEGHIEYRPVDAAPAAVGMLQSYVANRSDAWEYALEDLRQLASRPRTAGIQLPTGGFVAAASQLGQRTAELHAELTAAMDDPRWRPQEYDAAAVRAWSDGALALAERTFRTLDGRLDQLSGASREACERVRDAEDTVRERFTEMPRQKITVTRIRCHGDYHLGQVLWTGEDFVIIDFEGEPTRPLTERRQKHCALRDVASMVRSFHYAANFAARTEGAGNSSPSVETCELWYQRTRDAYLQAYRSTAAAASFVPQSQAEWDRLLSVQLLEKAVYELDYELRHRPDWVDIPAVGILDLLAT